MARKEQIIKLGEEYQPYLEKYAAMIQEIQKECSAEIKAAKEVDVGTPVDELFVLRFILSNDTVEECVTNIKKTLEWRTEKKPLLQKIAKGGFPPHHHEFSRFQVVGWVGNAQDGHPIFIVRTGLCDTKGLMQTLSIDEVAEYFILNNECGFQKCDKASRATGKLIKVIGGIDLAGFSLFNGRSDNRFFKAMGNSSHMSEVFFPQLQGVTCVLNVPSTFQVMMKLFGSFQNKRAMEKQKLCPAQQIWKKDANDCPFLKRHGAVNQVPDFVGGTFPTPVELQDVAERKNKTESLYVASGKKGEIRVKIPEPNTVVTYEFLSESSSVLVSASVNDIQVLKETKVSADEGLQEGHLTCPTSGELVIVVDNVKHWTSRTLQYCIKVGAEKFDDEE